MLGIIVLIDKKIEMPADNTGITKSGTERLRSDISER